MSENASQMDSERSRLESFVNCPHVDQRKARRLASYGWHYDKRLNKVRCHVCSREVVHPFRDEASDIDVHLHWCHIARNILPHSNQESLRSRRICREFDQLGVLPVESAIEEHVRRGNIPDQSNVSSREVLTDGSTHGLRGGFSVQVQGDEGPSARLVNGRIYNRHQFYERRIESPQEETPVQELLPTDQLLLNPSVTSLDVYRNILDCQWRLDDGTLVLEGRDALVL